jgi:hypothetical protein
LSTTNDFYIRETMPTIAVAERALHAQSAHAAALALDHEAPDAIITWDMLAGSLNERTFATYRA